MNFLFPLSTTFMGTPKIGFSNSLFKKKVPLFLAQCPVPQPLVQVNQHSVASASLTDGQDTEYRARSSDQKCFSSTEPRLLAGPAAQW